MYVERYGQDWTTLLSDMENKKERRYFIVQKMENSVSKLMSKKNLEETLLYSKHK